MKIAINLIVIIFLSITGIAASAQSTDIASLQQTARSLMRQGDYENAMKVVDKGLAEDPENFDLLKDKTFIAYLKRDFSSAIELGKQITARKDADVQSFQILGLAYKAIAEGKESEKMYKNALKKFPNSAVLYSEYGELLFLNNRKGDAIDQWEKGIAADANYSSNYYFAAKYYAETNRLIRSLLYAETFVNMESFTSRTSEIKQLLVADYQKVFSNPTAALEVSAKANSFEKTVAAEFGKLIGMMGDGVTPETLTAFHTRFTLNWFNGDSRMYPFRLFEHYRLLLQQGYFDAYNQWLIGAETDTGQYQAWIENHPEAVEAFQHYQKSVVYKIPDGQFYPN